MHPVSLSDLHDAEIFCRLIWILIVISTFSKKEELEIVIFCGSPGAGKSTFYWKYLKPLGYERVNQDILKTVRETRGALPIHSLPTKHIIYSASEMHQSCKRPFESRTIGCRR